MDDRATSDWTATRRRERVVTLAVVGSIHLAVLGLLLAYSPDRRQRIADQTMQLITLRPPTAPPRPASRPSEPHKASDPPVKRSPPPPRPAAAPAPVTIAVAADPDLSASVGSGSLAGLGVGNGDLGGGSGGGGSGGGGGLARHAEWVGGGIGNRDYPEAAKRARLQGVVDVLFTVHTDGRVSGCRIDHSSGSLDLDRLTCALTEQRLLYNPALDASGKPTEEIAGRRFRFVMSPRRDR
jgi:protein TonB